MSPMQRGRQTAGGGAINAGANVRCIAATRTGMFVLAWLYRGSSAACQQAVGEGLRSVQWACVGLAAIGVILVAV